MTDPKVLLAAVAAGLQSIGDAIDSERAGREYLRMSGITYAQLAAKVAGLLPLLERVMARPL